MLNLATIFVYIDGVCSQVHINQLYKHMWHTFTIFFLFILAYLFAIKNLTENLGYREWVSLRIRLILSKGIFNFVKNLKRDKWKCLFCTVLREKHTEWLGRHCLFLDYSGTDRKGVAQGLAFFTNKPIRYWVSNICCPKQC